MTGEKLRSRISRDMRCDWMTNVYLSGKKKEDAIGTQNVPEHHAWYGQEYFLGYRIEYHIFRLRSVRTIRYENEDLHDESIFYTAKVGPAFVLMNDYTGLNRTVIVNNYLEREKFMCLSRRRTRTNLISLKIILYTRTNYM